MAGGRDARPAAFCARRIVEHVEREITERIEQANSGRRLERCVRFALEAISHDDAIAALGRKLDDGAAGGSIRRAQAALDELARFEQE
jgi:hypothetical protein